LFAAVHWVALDVWSDTMLLFAWWEAAAAIVSGSAEVTPSGVPSGAQAGAASDAVDAAPPVVAARLTATASTPSSVMAAVAGAAEAADPGSVLDGYVHQRTAQLDALPSCPPLVHPRSSPAGAPAIPIGIHATDPRARFTRRTKVGKAASDTIYADVNASGVTASLKRVRPRDAAEMTALALEVRCASMVRHPYSVAAYEMYAWKGSCWVTNEDCGGRGR